MDRSYQERRNSRRSGLRKIKRNTLGLCFSQTPNPQATNYVLVFSTSRSSFNGIFPTVVTSTSTNSSPVSGSGTITSNSGSMWNYTYEGTETTTTTTSTQENLPYTDTTSTLYVNAYSQNGALISQRWRSITTRQGGEGANTLGYNLGAALRRRFTLKNVYSKTPLRTSSSRTSLWMDRPGAGRPVQASLGRGLFTIPCSLFPAFSPPGPHRRLANSLARRLACRICQAIGANHPMRQPALSFLLSYPCTPNSHVYFICRSYPRIRYIGVAWQTARLAPCSQLRSSSPEQQRTQ